MTHDPTRDLALDPSTAPAQLADIATHRPDLRALVAAHPQAYPALLDWLRGLGDPGVVAAIEARGASAPVVPAPRAAEQGAGTAPAGWSPAGAQDPGWATSGVQPGSVRGPEGEPTFGQPTFGQPAFGQPAFAVAGADGGASGVPGGEIPAAPRRRRRGLVVAGVAAGAAVVLGGAAFAVHHFVLDKLDGSESPRAAFDQLVAGLEAKDALAMLGAMSPAEVSSMSNLLDSTLTSSDSAASATSIKAFTDVLDALTLTTEGVTTAETALQDGLTKVEVTAGTLTLDGDPEKIADAFLAVWDETVANNASLTDLLAATGGAMAPDPQAMRSEIVAELEESLPATASFTDMAREGAPFFVVTVEEDGAWYVSPYLSLGEVAYIQSGTTNPRGTMLGEDSGTGAASPAAAGDALVRAALSGDVDAIIAALPLPERRVLSVYLPTDQTFTSTVTASGTFVATSTDGDRARIVPDGLTLTAAEQALQITFDGPCLTLAVTDPSMASEGRVCTDEAPLLSELGLSKLALVAVKEGDGWFVSPTETLVDVLRTSTETIAELRKDGRLTDDAWLTERSTALLEYLSSQPLFADLVSQLGAQSLGGTGLPGLGGDLATEVPGLDGFGTDTSGLGDDGLSGDEGLFGEEGPAEGVDLGSELARAQIALVVRLMAEPDGADAATILEESGYTAPPGVVAELVDLDLANGTYCLVVTDVVGDQGSRAVDAQGTTYDAPSCG